MNIKIEELIQLYIMRIFYFKPTLGKLKIVYYDILINA